MVGANLEVDAVNPGFDAGRAGFALIGLDCVDCFFAAPARMEIVCATAITMQRPC